MCQCFYSCFCFESLNFTYSVMIVCRKCICVMSEAYLKVGLEQLCVWCGNSSDFMS